MKLSTRSRYGLSLMLELARHYGEGPIFLQDISKKHDLSIKYLGNLILPLKTAGLILSVRGAHGGYLLSRNPCDISLLDIVEALEGPLCLVDCVDDASQCDKSMHCINRQVWADLSQVIIGRLRSRTLKEILEMESAENQNVKSWQI